MALSISNIIDDIITESGNRTDIPRSEVLNWLNDGQRRVDRLYRFQALKRHETIQQGAASVLMLQNQPTGAGTTGTPLFTLASSDVGTLVRRNYVNITLLNGDSHWTRIVSYSGTPVGSLVVEVPLPSPSLATAQTLNMRQSNVWMPGITALLTQTKIYAIRAYHGGRWRRLRSMPTRQWDQLFVDPLLVESADGPTHYMPYRNDSFELYPVTTEDIVLDMRWVNRSSTLTDTVISFPDVIEITEALQDYGLYRLYRRLGEKSDAQDHFASYMRNLTEAIRDDRWQPDQTILGENISERDAPIAVNPWQDPFSHTGSTRGDW